MIFVTSSASMEERLTGLRAGAVDYIVKPFDPAEVMARVEIHLALAESRRSNAAASRPMQPPERPAATDRAASASSMDRVRSCRQPSD